MTATEQQESLERLNQNIEKFKNDLYELSENFKRTFEVVEHSYYDGEDNYLGEVKYLKCGENKCFSQSLREMIEEYFGDIGVS